MMLIMGVSHTCSKHSGGDHGSHGSAFRNPASPDILRSSAHPWGIDPAPRRSSREQPGPGATPRNSKDLVVQSRRGSAAAPPAGLNSPTRARSTNDLLAEARRVRESASAEAKRVGAGLGSPRHSADESATSTVVEMPEPTDHDGERNTGVGAAVAAGVEGLPAGESSREALGEEGRGEAKES